MSKDIAINYGHPTAMEGHVNASIEVAIWQDRALIYGPWHCETGENGRYDFLLPPLPVGVYDISVIGWVKGLPFGEIYTVNVVEPQEDDNAKSRRPGFLRWLMGER